MALTPGARLGPYEILSPLGAGGMGEVYRARDSRLERDIAIKILPPHAADDPEFRARFEREAKTISQLNHPNICSIYDIGRLRVSDATASQGGRVSDASASQGQAGAELDFIVMELLEGETLGARLQKGALPTEDVLRVASEIADALDKAHRKGIVHRDLKPANVMLTPTGSKLLDFGLAKPGVVSTTTIETRLAPSGGSNQPQPSRTASPASPRPSLDTPLTARGTILGTFQYMAPEQIEGDPADARTDIWAFGCVLYEMITGRRAFEAKSQASLIASILEKQPPPVVELQPMTPPALGRIVRTCLAKDPDDRFQTAHDLALQLDWIEEGGSAAGLPAPVIASRKRRDRLVSAGGALVLAAAAAVAAWALKPAPPPTAGVVTRFTDVLPEDQNFTRTGRRAIAISPDGTKVAYTANNQLYLRRMNEPVAAPVGGTNTGPAEPVFSADGESIVYWAGGVASSGDAGKLWRVSSGGGTPAPVCDANNPYGMNWNGSRIVFAQPSGIMAVADTGGVPEVLLPSNTEKSERLSQPQLVADGTLLLFTSTIKSADSQIELLDLASKERRVLVKQASAPRLVASGHLVFYRDSTLFAQMLDVGSRALRGTPVSMVQQVRTAGFSNGAQYLVSDSGTLAYLEGNAEVDLSLVWLDRTGKAEAIAAPARRHFEPRLSPDGFRIATATRDDLVGDVLIWDVRRGIETQVTRSDIRDQSPIWAFQGRELVFATDVKDTTDLFRRRVDLTTEAGVITETPDVELPNAITADGKTILVTVQEGPTAHVGRVSLEKPGVPEPLFGKTPHSRNAALSHDERWIAYEAREGERFEIYVRPYPNVTDGRHQISQGGGAWPVWSSDGRELFYVTGQQGTVERWLVSVPVKTSAGGVFDWGEPTRLFSITPYVRSTARGYDVAPGSQRFVAVANPDSGVGGARGTIRIVTHWFEELKARVK